jgi:hypothetical protein
MKVYLCGPISNNKNYRADFEEAKSLIEEAAKRGNEPVEIFSPVGLNLDNCDWEQCMRETIKMMLSCDTVVVLDSVGGIISRGAILEQMIAHEVGMSMIALSEFFLMYYPVTHGTNTPRISRRNARITVREADDDLVISVRKKRRSIKWKYQPKKSRLKWKYRRRKRNALNASLKKDAMTWRNISSDLF